MQGRVFTLLSSAAVAMMPLGLAIAGPLADVIGVRTWFLIGGAVTLALGVGGYFVPSLVNIEAQREEHSEPVAKTDVSRLSESALM
jgi:DHA3 family macrolide efflux protein-like MFS transporter